MCEFCQDKNEIENEIETNTGHWFLMKAYGKYALYYRHGDCSNACGISVNNCPMCGRKLVEEENEAELKPVIHARAIID